MTVDDKSQGSEYCMLDGSNESQGKESANTAANNVLVKVMMDTGAYRIWIPAATYEGVMEAVESTGAVGKNATIVYMDEDGDRCVLSEKTFVDCASLAKNRFKLWVQKAEGEIQAEKCKKWEKWAEMWAEKKNMWAAKKKSIYMAGYKAGHEAGVLRCGPRRRTCGRRRRRASTWLATKRGTRRACRKGPRSSWVKARARRTPTSRSLLRRRR